MVMKSFVLNEFFLFFIMLMTKHVMVDNKVLINLICIFAIIIFIEL